MERKLDRNRRLADYIYNDLNPQEVVEMEREISLDPQLSDSYELNMQVKGYLQAKIQLEEMRSDPQLEDAEKLAEMAFENPSSKGMEPQPVRRPGRKLIRNMAFVAAVAAGVTIIIAVGLVPSNMNQDRLFDHYYAPFEASDNSQRGENELYRNVAAGINSYVEGNYNQSIGQFSKLSSDPALQSEVHLYSALSYLGLGEYRSAQEILQSSLEGGTRYQAETLWYLSLCHMKNGEIDQANAVLSRLEMYDGLYKKDAQNLRKKLRRFTQ